MNAIKNKPAYEVYQVTQSLEWCCPGMLVFVMEGEVIGYQQNPDNGLTQTWAEDGETMGVFNPDDYVSCEQID